MIAIHLILAVLRLLDALRVRSRLRGLPIAAAVGDDAVVGDDDYLVWLAPGVALSAAGRRAAIGHARATGAEVVDLVPPVQSSQRLLLFTLTSGMASAKKPFAPFRGGGYAVLASRALVERSGRRWDQASGPAAMVTMTERLGRYAAGKVAWLVVPGLDAPPPGDAGDGPRARLDLWLRLFSEVAPAALALVLVVNAFGLVAPWQHVISGSILLAALHLHGAIALAGTPIKARDLAVFTLLRTVIEIATIARFLVAWRPGHEPAAITALRAQYEHPGRLLEDRLVACPLCRGSDLRQYQVHRDLIQHKPGRFVLDRCAGCGHIFQNPRLAPAGFAYYYGDAYDGLSEDLMELAFGGLEPNYQARAASVEGLITPSRWLDVGGGHGHFCASARRRFPGVRFEGLDLSESIEDAERRGWVDRSYRGLFPVVAPELRSGERYDVVTMSHYLEHTIDPIAEIRAANLVLADGGVLMVEVPDPASRIGKIFGSLWIPHLQPQHLHFVSIENLERILGAHGFEVARVHRGETHMFGDFAGIAWRMGAVLAPPSQVPWRPRVGTVRVLVRGAIRLTVMPLIVVGAILDLLLAPLLRRPGWSNTYRVVARKTRDLEPAAAVDARASA